VEREAVRIASRILTSSFLATISAALPLGARIKGTWPKAGIRSRLRRRDSCDEPSVATALNKPLATLSISSSICCSVEEGELRMV
jgi:hypothetical protein